MNLATARSFHRAKEIGLRKVVGATRSQLISQLLGESMMLTLIATLLSILLFDLALPYFNELSGKAFEANLATLSFLAFPLLLTGIGVGLVSGLLPAMSISGFKPVQVLKNQLQTGKKAQRLRKALVITQFSLSILMIASTLVVYSQLQYIQNKELGFKKDQLVVIDINSGAARGNFMAMKEAFAQHPDVLKVSATSRVPGEWKGITQIQIAYLGGQDSMKSLFFCGDEDMLDVFEIELLQGRNFSGNPQADSLGCLINETAARRLGLANPVGQKLFISDEELQPTIIGVVKDFHIKSLHEAIEPLIIGAWKNPIRAIDYFSMQINASNVEATLAHIESVQTEFDPGTPLEYHFLDDQIELFYEEDRRTGKVFAIGAMLTILIACLGLLGLAAYTVERRTKEIGIRKVVGASSGELVLMLVRHFAVQVGIAFVIASPIAWYLMRNWLENFSYKQNLQVSLFFLAGLIALVVSIATVGYRSFQAARMNPVKALREN
jgi:putative ABC transport system permease protein